MFRLRILMAALAILSLASMPFGYMPDRGADGGFVLRICGGTMPMVHRSGHEASAGSMHHGAHDKKDQSSSGQHEIRCNYAVPGLAAMPAAALVEDRIVLPLADEPLVQHPLTGLFPPHLPPSTGPPSA
mgnify:CR=1 FL=1